MERITLAGHASSTGKKFPAADAVPLRIEKSLACRLINNCQVSSRME
jgi:hypothetical protein